jgi:hypothetical protein
MRLGELVKEFVDVPTLTFCKNFHVAHSPYYFISRQQIKIIYRSFIRKLFLRAKSALTLQEGLFIFHSVTISAWLPNPA